jgi:sulfur carrier protein ThiS
VRLSVVVDMAQISVHVTYYRNIAQHLLEEGSTVEKLLGEMNLFPDAHIVLRGKTPVPLSEVLKNGDELRIIRVASGG